MGTTKSKENSPQNLTWDTKFYQILIKKTTYDQAILDGPNFIEVHLELIPCTRLTWVLQFCSVFGFDDIDGLLAGCDFIGLIMYVHV